MCYPRNINALVWAYAHCRKRSAEVQGRPKENRTNLENRGLRSNISLGQEIKVRFC